MKKLTFEIQEKMDGKQFEELVKALQKCNGIADEVEVKILKVKKEIEINPICFGKRE